MTMEKTTLRYRGAKAFLVLVLLIATAGVGVAYARQIASYDLIVLPFSGDAFTAPLTKVGPTRAVDNNTSIGGNNMIHTMVYRGMTRVTGRHLIASGTRLAYPYNTGQNLPGPNYRLKHETRWWEPVHVQTRGTWSPDER